jgi:hypothetical protein
MFGPGIVLFAWLAAILAKLLAALSVLVGQ